MLPSFTLRRGRFFASLRSARFPAVVLLLAAAAGLVVANSAAGPGALALKDAAIGVPGLFSLSLGHAISDGLLAVFFFVVAIELRHELTRGELRSFRLALQPAIAAAGGVIVPIALYVLIAGGVFGGGDPATASGWPIPTATDIAFALGVLAVFGRGLPSGIRVFLLALAILDDIVGIVFIAVLFTTGIDGGMLALAALAVVLFGVLTHLSPRGRAVRLVMGALAVVIALVAWLLTYESGVHATIAGVALGLVMAPARAEPTRHALEPWVNGLVLPIFAFSAALVAIPAVSPTELSPAFWGVLIALPVGKLIGIALAGAIGQRLFAPPGAPRLAFADLLAAGALGGIGFTVSLLLSELAFAGDALVRDEAVLGVLCGSVIALVLAGILVSWRSWHYRRLATSTA
ncbi:Na+/H+ antiporter NhaA [uncultured Microbacterium sp.]|uniref:Na+/H+ antiporter NhaA n=1 Tax=uncultured Microbacterium sp. TaxID=191216 RepID=UPI0025F15984|nr:Na+/H+ antiporter NhaA [uncultured Microbacterium sp.]